jgi:hypothetical protein
MAHFAEIDANNFVRRVIVVNNSELLDVNGVEREYLGAAFCTSLFGGTWIQTSYNGNVRKNFAGVGHWYDPDRDAFIAPQPFDSWVLDEDTCTWVAPVPMPDDGGRYVWDEATVSWIEPMTIVPETVTIGEDTITGA